MSKRPGQSSGLFGLNKPRKPSPSKPIAKKQTLELKPGAEPKSGYRLTRRLGAGAYGEVWEAVTPENCKVALKFMPTKKNSPELVANELRLLTSLRLVDHPHVLRIEDAICIQDMIVLVMELAKGSLHDLHQFSVTNSQKHLSSTLLIELLVQAARGLDFLGSTQMLTGQLTQKGLQHCDVKPSNLLLVGRILKVADFGLMGRQGIQTTHDSIGTPYFAPPELFTSKPNARTDQYSLAVTYCYLRTGHYPYQYDPKKPPEGNPDLERFSSREREVLRKALQLNWIDRYSSCTEFIESLHSSISN